MKWMLWNLKNQVLAVLFVLLTYWFFPEGERSDTHIRLNLAAPQQTIQRAAEQLETVLKRVLRA